MNINNGIIKGKFVKNYDSQIFSKKKYYKPNSFLKREIKKDDVVLDLCCGTGVSLIYLEDRCKKIYGIDASLDMINECKKKIKQKSKIVLIKSEANKTPINDNFFDVVLIRMGLHHMKNKKAVIEECYRILKNDGKLLIMDHFQKYNIFMTNLVDVFRNLKRKNSLFGHYYCKIDYLISISSHVFKLSYRKDVDLKFFKKSNLIFVKKL